MTLPRWLPLESNPDILNGFMDRMGVKDDFRFYDVYGLDDDLLGMVPQPVLGICLLFPCDTKAKERRNEILLQGNFIQNPEDKGIFYVKQLDQFGNACGTIATVHAVANIPTLTFKPDSVLHKFITNHFGCDANKIGTNLANTMEIHEASDIAASDDISQTQTPDRDDTVDHHFVSFVNINERLIELDGRMPGPIDHGSTSAETFLKDATKAVKKNFMDLNPESVDFNITALCKA